MSTTGGNTGVGQGANPVIVKPANPALGAYWFWQPPVRCILTAITFQLVTDAVAGQRFPAFNIADAPAGARLWLAPATAVNPSTTAALQYAGTQLPQGLVLMPAYQLTATGGIDAGDQFQNLVIQYIPV